jgi:hypothetical protein
MIGDSHNLISKEFGSRIRGVSVITDAPIPEDDMWYNGLSMFIRHGIISNLSIRHLTADALEYKYLKNHRYLYFLC